jgi:hypothetical protein
MLKRLARYGKSLATALSAEGEAHHKSKWLREGRRRRRRRSIASVWRERSPAASSPTLPEQKKTGPTAVARPLVMFRFETPEDLERWHVSTDAYFGGRSRASLDLVPSPALSLPSGSSDEGNSSSSSGGSGPTTRQQQQHKPYATFRGRCSMAPTLAQVEELERERKEDQAAADEEEAAGKGGVVAKPTRRREGGAGGATTTTAAAAKTKQKPKQIAHTSSNAEIARAGYAVAASKVLDLSDPFDLSRHTHLVYTLRGDGGRYVASVRADSLSGGGGDVWQAPFSAPRGHWADVRVPLSSFALTHRGQLVGRRLSLRADRVLSVGLSFAAAGQDAGWRGGAGGESGSDDENGDGLGGGGTAFRLDVREIRAEAADDECFSR